MVHDNVVKEMYLATFITNALLTRNSIGSTDANTRNNDVSMMPILETTTCLTLAKGTLQFGDISDC